MASTDNWLKLCRWWQEHLKSRFNSSLTSSSSNTDVDQNLVSNSLLHRRSSLMSFRHANYLPLTNVKKRASFGGVDERQQIGGSSRNSVFRHVRDSIRNKSGRSPRSSTSVTNNKRRQFQKSTTCDVSVEENENQSSNVEKVESSPMNNRARLSRSRRFSLIRVESSSSNPNELTIGADECKSSQPTNSPNLIQKLLFRQFSPKTRPYATHLASDESMTTATVPNDKNLARRTTTVLSSTNKNSWSNSTSSPNQTRQVPSEVNENSFLSPPNAFSGRATTDLSSYLSRRRNTTGSISLNKIVDLKNTSAANVLKVSSTSTSTSSSNKLINENIFQSVEDSDLLLTKQILENNDNSVNSLNEYQWCPLDVAIMLNNCPMVHLLVQHGAEESPSIQPEESRYKSVCHQLTLISQQQGEEAIKKSVTNKLANEDVSQNRRSSTTIETTRHRRASKGQQDYILLQQQLNQQRTATLMQMKDNFDQAGVPDAPTNVRLIVSGSNSVTVTYDEPNRSHGAMVIKYKIEWCSDENFEPSASRNMIIGSDLVNFLCHEYIIRNLPIGQKCYVRVSAGNMRGFGPPTTANPPYCVPSNWREFSKTSRPNINDLRFEEILNRIRPEKIVNERVIIMANNCSTSINNGPADGNESPEVTTPINSARNRRRSYGNLRRNIRQLFQQNPRLARTMKRGLYLVSVMLQGGRILVTNEDVLPMIEVDENYGHTLFSDFQWFMKLTFVWDDLKALRPDLERCSSATTFYLRMKLVQAAIELQTLQETTNLGRLHHSYIRDSDGNVAFVLINASPSNVNNETRQVSTPSNLKWISISKFFETAKENVEPTSNDSCLQQIIDKLPEMLEFYYASVQRLDSGLYVAYLKMQNSVDCVRVMVHRHRPGSLPCIKIRSVANVSKDEWQWLHKNSSMSNSNEAVTPTTDTELEDNGLSLFKQQFRAAAKELCLMLNLPETHFSNSRIYDAQVVEVRDDLSLIILMSNADEVNVLSTPSSSNATFNSSPVSYQRSPSPNNYLDPLMYLPVYIFEVLQLLSNNYRFISQYSLVSICLDFELICAQQSQREAFSIVEADESRFRLNQLLSCQQDLDDIWRSSRWLVDVINCAKDKSYAGISLKSWLTFQAISDGHLKINSSESSLPNYASDSALDTVKYSGTTLSIPTTMTSTSLSSPFLNESKSINNCDSGFIDLEHATHHGDRYTGNRSSTISSPESNDPMDLTLYIPVLASNTLIPFRVRCTRLTTSNELVTLVQKQHSSLLKSVSTLSSTSNFCLVWVRANNREQILADHLTAIEIEKRLIRYGGQLHLRSKGLSTSRSSQPLIKLSSPRLSPQSANIISSNHDSNRPGSNLSLNIQ